MRNRRRGKHPCQLAGIRVEKCGPTGKLSYRTEGAAHAAIELAHETAAVDARRREQRAYPCKYGPHWHVTSEASIPRIPGARRHA